MEGKTCCVTGHRDIPADETAYVKVALRQEIGKAVNDGFTIFLSGFWMVWINTLQRPFWSYELKIRV